ncbi:MAG: hypothetical protein NXI30_04570 [bacterium]|nr:hypothetical protein [bacterium]
MKGWKTALVALLIVIFGGLQTFFESVEMDTSTQGWVLMGIGVVMTTLRAMTSTPIFQDDAE